jgi:hypothetical protein
MPKASLGHVGRHLPTNFQHIRPGADMAKIQWQQYTASSFAILHWPYESLFRRKGFHGLADRLFAFAGAVFAVELEEDRGVGHRHCGLEDEDLVVLASFADPAEDLFH